jgi:hypothetical protein
MQEKTRGQRDLYGFCRIENRKGVFGAVSKRSKKKWAKQAAARPGDCPVALDGDGGLLPRADNSCGRAAICLKAVERDGDASRSAIPLLDDSAGIADRVSEQAGAEGRAGTQHRTRAADLGLGLEGAARPGDSVYGRDL